MSHGIIGAGRRGDWIQGSSGGPIFPFDPRPGEIHIEDIAHALAGIARFTGHSNGKHRFRLSVAQHSVAVSRACDPADALAGLLHDASDMAFNDLARPLKYLPEYATIRAAETRFQEVIYARFGLGPYKPVSVHIADSRALAAEARDLMRVDVPGVWEKWLDEWEPLPEPVVPLPPDEAEALFLSRFESLTRKDCPS